MTNSPRRSPWRARLWFLVALAVPLTFAAQEIRWTAARQDEKRWVEGVSNFGRVDDHVYRGAQPTPAGFETLRQMGIDTVVRLSMGEEGSAAEEREVRGRGMRFVNLPWSTTREPTREQFTTFLTLMRESQDARVFIHCKAGSDRTGVMVALYRMTMQGWSPDGALEEMQAFHFRPMFLPHLARFVEQFPAALAADPGLRGLRMSADQRTTLPLAPSTSAVSR